MKEGYKLLSKYINANVENLIKCSEGHIYKSKYSYFYSGNRCPICYGNKKLTYEFVKEKIEKEGYELLSKEYKNIKSKLKVRCPEGHEYPVIYDNFKKGKRCKKCHVKKINGENSHLWKGGVSEKNIPLYDTYAHQINYCEEVRRRPEDKNILEVKCTYCGKWYNPKRKDVLHRISALNGNEHGGNNFYCSEECKQKCPIYNKQLYQENHPNKPENNRPYQQEWSQMVCEREDYKCEICGEYGNIGHHILPVKPYPHLQADVDNGVCLCEKCHYIVHQIEGCKTGQLANLVC